jgi:hypothetical protein
MPGCIRCESERLIFVCGKTSDLCHVVFNQSGHKSSGYVPTELGIGGDDYLDFNLCLNCGQVQDDFPRPFHDLEVAKEDE